MRFGFQRTFGRLVGAGVAGIPHSDAVAGHWPMTESGYSTAILSDVVGGNHITATLGQALDFDGVADGIYTDDDLMDFMHGQSKICYYAIFRQPSTVTNTDGILLAGGRTTVNSCVRLYTPLTRKLRVYTRTAAGMIIFDTDTGAYENDVWTGFIFVLDVSGTPSGQFYFKNYTTGGAWTAATTTRSDVVSTTGTTISLETTTGWRRFSAGAGFTDTTIAYTADVTIYCAGIGAFSDYLEAVSILNGSGSTSEHFLMTLDDGASLTTAAVTGKTATAVTGVSIDATSWLNGTHVPSIPQKGFGGGAYTGGLGATVLNSYSVTGDADPGSGISASEINTLGSSFTWEGWIYKPAADPAAQVDYFGNTDTTSGVPFKAFRLRSPATTTNLTFVAYGATIEAEAVVAANASGWWYCACVLRAGVPELYVAQPAASSFTSNVSGTNAGSCSSNTANNNKLYIMARYHASGTQNNCTAGTRLKDVWYHAGAALTEAQLLERFTAMKSEYI